MRCNWQRWLWGVIPLFMLSWIAVQAERPRIEQELAAASVSLLQQSGSSWAVAVFEGRDAILDGKAWDEGDADKAADILRKLRGVRIVDSKASLIEKADTYVWTATRRSHRIRLSGFVPNIVARQAILGVTKANFPGYEVVDRMSLMRGMPSADAWLGGVSFALKQLVAMRRGDVHLENLALSIAGEAEDLAAYRAIKSAVLNSPPKGVKVSVDQLTPPMISPYTWAASLADGKLELSGYFPDEAVRAELIANAKAGSHGAEIIDHMQLGGGAPQDWAAAARTTLRVLAELESGSAEMKDATLIISGVSADETAARAARRALRAELPGSIKLTEQIRPREPRRAATETPRTPEPAAPIAKTDTPAQSKQKPDTPSKSEATEPKAKPETKASVEAPAEVKACQSTLVELTNAGHILFERASAALDAASSTTLAKLAEAVKSCPNAVVRIEGHTDMEGTSEHNEALALRRAQSVLDSLVKAGVDARQLEPAGYGETRPVAPNDTAENRAKNRRIEFVVRPR